MSAIAVMLMAKDEDDGGSGDGEMLTESVS